MNIFKDFESLVTFPVFDGTDDFQRVAKEIGCELGDHKFLLNKYLSEVFKISSHIDITLAVQLADKICSEVLSDCYKIFGLEDEHEDSKYFSLIEKYITENPIDIRHSHTKAKYYAAKILLNHLETFAGEFINSLKEKFKYISFSSVDQYYQEMAKILSEDRVEYLNDLICEAFFICLPEMTFIGQILAKCVKILVYRDPDTSKQIFEIMMEE